jgi:molybdopterin converting factor small subunit
MANEKKVCATIKCPPLREAGADFVGKTVGEVRAMLKDKLEIADGATVTSSVNGGDTFSATNDNHVIADGEVVEFGRGSSTKGC